MATLLLFVRAAQTRSVDIHAVTVDHKLRPEAAEEAVFVAKTCADLGVPHTTLSWEHGDITGNLQDQARRARYRLIAEWAHAHNIAHVALGHTVDDQAETVLMKLARSAGVDGLAGMSRSFEQDGVRFERPLLSFSRQDLRACLQRNNLGWVEDPSNTDERFDRVKARNVLAMLAPLGIDAERLGAVAHNAAMAKWALDHYMRQEAGTLVQEESGDLILTRSPKLPVPQEIERRLLVQAIQWVSGADHPVRYSALVSMDAAFIQADTHTLSGCLLRLDASNGILNQKLRITREHNAVKDLTARTDEIWDGRWVLEGPHAPDLEIRALGEDGLRQVTDWRDSGMPRVSLLSSPGVWRGAELISAPIAGYLNGWRAKLVESRDDFAAWLIRR
ncbi:tRNA(Ile)-lysidine synthetase [Candidatus Rhodobacter oscarellae]|uniref:tRNA(Ile)-lysidine synthase n=2 Tax=Candidatus Rhodobacter oscarellae TaxID=1675527 RepID=A0A0J9EA07_9RHOB|nr:tRNA(Ile)-lysidine synthetase [Candidatus Rhodobacter lobularis]